MQINCMFAVPHRLRHATEAAAFGRTRIAQAQEQSQTIAIVRGTPMQIAPPIIDTKADSRLPSGQYSRPDMPLLHEPPRVVCPLPKDERSNTGAVGVVS